MPGKTKIIYLSEKEPKDYTSWSGSIANMYLALQKQGYEIEWVPFPEYTKFEQSLFTFIQKSYQKIFNRKFNTMHFLTKAYLASRKIEKSLYGKDYDILFAPISAGLIPFVKISKPILYVNDANAAQLFNYNILFTGFGWLSKKITKYLERQTMLNAAATLFPSQWAVDFASKEYKIPREKLHLVKFGANMPIQNTPVKNRGEIFNLLFFATRWDLKGGQIAYNAFLQIKAKRKIHFTILGCAPNIVDPNVTIIPFVNKNNSEGIAQLKTEIQKADLLILPTRNEAYGVVFCEASAYGIPSLATDTGGVSSVVEEGVNGFLMPYDASVEEWASKIEEIMDLNAADYAELSHSCQKKYEEELNWEVWGKQVNTIIRKAIEENGG